ncbi:hypothetical protein DV735_g3001, partial [Chaetothyriales sp. CBS 134920]
MPRSANSEEDAEPIQREAIIYQALGQHPCIAQCLSIGEMDHVDIKYYPNGDLETYLRQHRDRVTRWQRAKWFEQIIEGVDFIHGHGVIHSDLALRQYLVDDNLNALLADFNASQLGEHVALGYEKATHCLPRDYTDLNTVASDLFALGSTLYELCTGTAAYNEIYPLEPEDVLHSSDPEVILARVYRKQQADAKVEQLFAQEIFPDVSHLQGGRIILGLWRCEFPSTKAALLSFKSPRA